MNIIITGGSRGFGKAIAEKFAEDKQGHTILLCSRNKEMLMATVKELQARFPRNNVQGFTADLTDKHQIQAFADWCLKIGTPDILINNAGVFVPGTVHNEPDGNMEWMINTNLMAAYHLTRAVVEPMKQNKKGHIFNICSIASIKAYANGGSYGVSKFALYGFSKNLREELKPHFVKVTSIIPGAAYTDSWKGSGVEEDRIMQAKDIADMIYAAAHLSAAACVEEIIMRPQLGDL